MGRGKEKTKAGALFPLSRYRVRERAGRGEAPFLPAAKPTGQGAESVGLLVVVGVASFLMQTQKEWEKERLFQK